MYVFSSYTVINIAKRDLSVFIIASIRPLFAIRSQIWNAVTNGPKTILHGNCLIAIDNLT